MIFFVFVIFISILSFYDFYLVEQLCTFLGPYSLRKLKICLTFESSKLEEIFKEFK